MYFEVGKCALWYAELQVKLRTVASAFSEVPRYPPYEARVQTKSISYDVNHKAFSGQTLDFLISGTKNLCSTVDSHAELNKSLLYALIIVELNELMPKVD